MKKYIEYLKYDLKNFNKNNSNEKRVVESKCFSAYKGSLVIRTNMKRSGSYGILFISRKINRYKYPEDVIRHEYGHYLQMKRIGIIRYTLFIGIPSLLNWGKGSYYEKPWEITADILGDVRSRKHNDYNIDKGNDYLKKWS